MEGGWIRPDGRAMSDGAALKLFVDEYRTPIRAGRVVEGLFLALEKSPGILHLSGGERVSRYDFGHMIAEMHTLKKAHIVACRQTDVDLGAPRPADVSLNIDKARALGFKSWSLREGVAGASLLNYLPLSESQRARDYFCFSDNLSSSRTFTDRALGRKPLDLRKPHDMGRIFPESLFVVVNQAGFFYEVVHRPGLMQTGPCRPWAGHGWGQRCSPPPAPGYIAP